MSVPGPKEPKRMVQAGEWLTRLREAPKDEKLLADWLRWCEADRSNAEAFADVQQLWRQLDVVHGSEHVQKILRGGISEARGSPATPLPAYSRSVSKPSWRISVKLAMVACLTTVTIVTALVVFRAQDSLRLITSQENRATVLPDGSAVELAAKTLINVDFRRDMRLVSMRSGEAYFAVKPDKKRPFKVRAGNLDVTAVGTAFDVKHAAEGIVVTVEEGIVAVEPLQDGTAGESWRVVQGYQLTYSAGGNQAILSAVDTSTALAWREGRLEYTNEPIQVVVNDISRYTRYSIEIADPGISKLSFTGTVFTDSIDNWLEALPAALPVKVVHSGDRILLLANTGELSARESASNK